ncbi:response regulator [Granulicella sp. 5B5]|uniref:LytR/AlgR family response regulator transcription factor n=1 Tax=Granulicella sp. 5B5 TaxID=1617967 RepID=UPI0015F49B2C|nr:LytTR family DNA-binding domain-containing protein [Granulicella sp. 5B5]QMV17869.1 response regulator [Granulicella sp. 5B5]
MRLQTVIVDDEPLALDLLKLLLTEHRDIEIVAECQNGEEAVSWLQSKPADLLFLDVQMPELGGFEVVEQVGLRHLPSTIFVTAYHEHAVRAFDIHAVDYLTKPVNAERLATALMRVREKIAARAALLTQEQLTAVLNGLKASTQESRSVPRFLVKDGEKEILLSADQIDWIEAADYYCCLHVNGRRYMLRESIADLSGKLNPRQFVRIHRSSIVNLDRIRDVYREGQTENAVVLEDGQRLKMSRTGRQKLTEVGKP